MLEAFDSLPGTHKERKEFMSDYNRKYKGKARPGKHGKKWPELTPRKLGELIRYENRRRAK